MFRPFILFCEKNVHLPSLLHVHLFEVVALRYYLISSTLIAISSHSPFPFPFAPKLHRTANKKIAIESANRKESE